MVIVIFESHPLDGKSQVYLDMAAELTPLVQQVDGFISVERFESITNPGKLLALSCWEDEDAVRVWRENQKHLTIQKSSRRSVFEHYQIRVATVTRSYDMKERVDNGR